MDLSKLSQNEKLALYGAVAVIVGAVLGYGASGLGILALLAAIAMLAILFLPQMSPTTRLPGSKGSLMLIAGGVAGVVLVLGLLNLLAVLGALLRSSAVPTIFYLIAVIGGVLMAWAGWQEFQSEGGKWVLGSGAAGAAAGGTTSAAPTAARSSEPMTAPAPTEPVASQPAAPEPAEPAAPAEEADRTNDEGRPPA